MILTSVSASRGARWEWGSHSTFINTHFTHIHCLCCALVDSNTKVIKRFAQEQWLCQGVSYLVYSTV